MNAYMTVEASMIMPLVLAVIVILIFGSFYLYNRCVATQDAYLLCMKEAQHKDAENTRDASRVTAAQAGQFGSKYIGISSITGTAAYSRNHVTYKGTAVVGPGVSIVRLILPTDRWDLHFSGSSEVRDAAYRIRNTRRSAMVLHQAGGLLHQQERSGE